jgi:hypothetical protein
MDKGRCGGPVDIRKKRERKNKGKEKEKIGGKKKSKGY